MSYLIVIIIAYFIGAISPARIITHMVLGIDIRDVNSKSAGTSNALMTLGIKYGVLVGLLDLLKGLLPVLILKFIFPDNEVIWIVGGLSAVLGHIYPIYMGFHGGKGTATFGGVIIGIAPLYSLPLIAIFTILTLLINYIAVSTLIVITFIPVGMFFDNYSYISITLVILFVILSFYKHFANLKRIYLKKEVGLREAFGSK